MSSRLGNILKAEDVIDIAKDVSDNKDDSTVLAAVKYAFLKHTIGGDIFYDPKESATTVGNSGPYLQYAHARACSIISKSDKNPETPQEMDDGERSLVRKVADFSIVTKEALESLAPNKICNYLFELTQEFNRFYESNQVVGSENEPSKLAILQRYKEVLSAGLYLLGIDAPERV